MHFCPSCSNLLLVENGVGENGETCLVCQTCPYQFPIRRQMISRTILKRKEVDDVLGGEEAWKNVDSIETPCPKCQHQRAYFMQIQLRSLDEPATIFFKCCNSECSHTWKEG
ncbi:putative Rpc11-DNA-directed RNA polymerase III subunit C11 [Linderina pennispora]|uniref:DNA-directed RNA polymerase subunit n=1 Tax=Linderina pennispora TaxID=61395 RepID=A0A1Y1W2U5_9FUNG|nr:putative Rpc11-DNA-directed RNA polymerase III subunit C11 [Linderina pennispora]XP_040741712.1 putative Rpc11-DNA-directed RNA polymerase III subunit C11 [Linderina pennispora]XP_040741719.1 putative Rpc11-DNA-directed RNA polymerase III subunit C11 [Linderina pennispora]KAJ1957999.1 RNA polymerase III C11 subunit [Linderina pennispora]ORX64372.1 putative Rpc11-DNA-directed RNA polymerase III subunit C11 [Linderina pennispora]ORX67866.1 putative Rpc11-DNA-directed RNA polymerase III subuni